MKLENRGNQLCVVEAELVERKAVSQVQSSNLLGLSLYTKATFKLQK